VAISVNWDDDARCSACQGPIGLGEEMLYGRHLGCARSASAARRQAATSTDVFATAQAQLGRPGHIQLTGGQLRELISAAQAAGTALTRRPDKGKRCRWYARMGGWAEERVNAGLDAGEVAGMWADFLDTGRMPPIRHIDLEVLLEAVSPAGARKT
jgi:hypothetical protein